MNNFLNTIHLSDNIEFLKTLPDNSVDAIITDSPYGLGKKQNLIKLLKAWIEIGYYEITGSGFMGKKWDAFVPQPILWKECLRVLKPGGYLLSFFGTRTYHLGSLAIELAGFEIRDCIQWIYGSGFPKSKACLKPANEPICVARKPGSLIDLNIDEARIETDWSLDAGSRPNGKKGIVPDKYFVGKSKDGIVYHNNPAGRWPANVIIDETVANDIDYQSGITGGGNRSIKIGRSASGKNGIYGTFNPVITKAFNDKGGASRFFYVAKASPSERAGATHPTIKPVKLITQLVKLYCPVGGIVVDPHNGSGTTCQACLETGRNYIGIDNDHVSHKEAENRIKTWHINNPKSLFDIK